MGVSCGLLAQLVVCASVYTDHFLAWVDGHDVVGCLELVDVFPADGGQVTVPIGFHVALLHLAPLL
jgi:hypothetical protein